MTLNDTNIQSVGLLWMRDRSVAETSTWQQTYLITFSIEQSPSCKAKQFSGSQEIPWSYGSRKFITVLTSARHLSEFWTISIQSIPPYPTSWISFLILSSHLCLGPPSGLFPSGFTTKTLYTPLLPLIRATCHVHLIILDLTPEQYWVRSTDHSAPHYVIFSTLLLPRPS